MKTGFYLFGISSQGSEEETKLFNELYDKFSHNELTTGEVITRIAEFQGIDITYEGYDKVYDDVFYTNGETYGVEIINGKTFDYGKFILSVCPFGEGYDIYLSDDLN